MMTLIVILYSIFILFNTPVNARQCYSCSCGYDWNTNTGTCSNPGFESSCTLINVSDNYCTISSTYNGNYEQRSFSSVKPNIYQDSHFFEAVETINFVNGTWSPTIISSITYGCNWDSCNELSLYQYLPDTFQMTVNQSILNSLLLGEGTYADDCFYCSKCSSGIGVVECPFLNCTNGFCFIDEIHNFVPTESNNCTYVYFSSCEQANVSHRSPYVRIRAIYYIDLPSDKQIEIDEIDLLCTKSYCNEIQVVEDLKGYVQTNINITSGFQPSRPNDTTPTTTVETTTPNHATSIISKAMVFLYFVLVQIVMYLIQQ